MEESSTHQAILGEGEVREARKLLRLLGDGAFGKPDARTNALIESLEDLDRRDELLQRVRTATSWEEMFNPPARRKGKRKGSH
jgi:hypothetical protein